MATLTRRPGSTCLWRARRATCDDRIGVYEPLWWQRPDGTLELSSLLRLGEDGVRVRPDSRVYHEA